MILRTVASAVVCDLMRALMQDGRDVHPAAAFSTWPLHADDAQLRRAPAIAVRRPLLNRYSFAAGAVKRVVTELLALCESERADVEVLEGGLPSVRRIALWITALNSSRNFPHVAHPKITSPLTPSLSHRASSPVLFSLRRRPAAAGGLAASSLLAALPAPAWVRPPRRHHRRP